MNTSFETYWREFGKFNHETISLKESEENLMKMAKKIWEDCEKEYIDKIDKFKKELDDLTDTL